MKNINASQTRAHVNTSATGHRPVMHNLYKPGLSVLPASALEDLCFGTELADEGWRIAEYPNTGLTILVRPWRWILRPANGKRWLKAWGCYVTDLEAREIDTGVKYGPDITGFALVAKLGRPITRRRFWTRTENITGL